MSDQGTSQTEPIATLPLAKDMREKAEKAKQQREEEERKARHQEAVELARELLETDVLPYIEEEATQGRFLVTIEISKTKGSLEVVNELSNIVAASGYQTSVIPKYAGTRSSNEATDYKGAMLCIEW